MHMPATAVQVIHDPAIALARQGLYRFAALSLVDPRAGSWRLLDEFRDEPFLWEAAALIRELPEARPTSLAPRELPLTALDPGRVLEKLPASESQLNELFERTFGLLVTNACPPYETEYIPSKFDFQRSNALADIAGFYRAFGLELSRSHPERPDHIVQELEFMAYVIGLESQAAALEDQADPERIAVCRQAQTRFLSEHLAWWVPALGKLLARENPDGFFAAVGRFLAAWIPAERGLLGVPAPSREPGPSSIEPPDACAGCNI
jgi:putative dimethyl sulfoxide reductase chaperone